MVRFDKARARDEIMFYMLQFELGVRRASGDVYSHGKGFMHEYSGEKAVSGDLILLTSIRMPRWSLCWLHDTRDSGTNYLCESVETGELCWWSNVGVRIFDRETVSYHPEWRWSDRQHEFNDRWDRVCRRDHNAYITLPVPASFGDGYEVTLATRTRYGLNDERPSQTFPDWRKVTKKMMGEFYQRCAGN